MWFASWRGEGRDYEGAHAFVDGDVLEILYVVLCLILKLRGDLLTARCLTWEYSLFVWGLL